MLTPPALISRPSHPLVVPLLFPAVVGFSCPHCQVGEAFSEFFAPQTESSLRPYSSEVHALWGAHVEVIHLTTDNGGFEPPSFHQRLAMEAIAGWARFRDRIVPGLPEDHELKEILRQKFAGAFNDGFYRFQKDLFDAGGDLEESLSGRTDEWSRPPGANSSWPEMQELPEYGRLRQIVEALSRRYLIRTGLPPAVAMSLNYSIFSWASVHGPGEFHEPHTHVGDYHVGVFYAQAGEDAGMLRWGDPRGQNPPFGKTMFHVPKSGDLVLFPAWLSHMVTATVPETSARIRRDGLKADLRVAFAFNIGPVEGPLGGLYWFSDPTSPMGFARKVKLDPKELGL